MKVYFACSVRDDKDDEEAYIALSRHIKARSTLFTGSMSGEQLTSQGMPKSSSSIWATDLDWAKASDAIIADVTCPCLGVGYQLAKAEEWDKPILALFRSDDTQKLSPIIAGSPKIQTVHYTTLDEARSAIDTFMKSIDSHYVIPLPYN